MAATPAMRASPAAFRVTIVPVGCPTTRFAMGTARAIKARMVSKTARRFMTPPPFGPPPSVAAHHGPVPRFPPAASRSPTTLGTLAFPLGPVKAAAPTGCGAEESALLRMMRESAAILGARWDKVPERHRPHYEPIAARDGGDVPGVDRDD